MSIIIRLGQWFLSWGRFTPVGKFHLPRMWMYWSINCSKCQFCSINHPKLSDSSLESLIVTRVESSHSVKNVIRVESSQSHQKSWLESSRMEWLTRVTLSLLDIHDSAKELRPDSRLDISCRISSQTASFSGFTTRRTSAAVMVNFLHKM